MDEKKGSSKNRLWSAICLLALALWVSAWPAVAMAQVGAPPPPKAMGPGSASEPGPVIDTLTPTLKWTAVSGADSYTVFVRERLGGSTVFKVADPWVTVPEGTFKPGLKYGWYAQAHGPGGWSLNSNTLHFQTQPQQTPSPTPTVAMAQVGAPPPPKAISPGSDAGPGPASDTLTPTLSWTTVAGADAYTVFVMERPKGNQVFINPPKVVDARWTVPEGILKPGLKYGWYVQAHGPGGWSLNSNSLYFQTQPPPAPSPLPTPTKAPPPTPKPQPTAPLAPTATTQGGVEYMTLLADDFESGQAQGWAIRGSSQGQWGVAEKGGNHFLELKGLVSVSPGSNPGWSDYALKVKAALLAGEATINFRLTGSGPGSQPTERYALVLSRQDLRLNKVKTVPDSMPQTTLLGSAPGEFKPGNWYAVSIELDGNRIAVSVDGVPKLRYVDTQEPILSGGFSFAASSLTTSHVLFDDVWVGRIKAPLPSATLQTPALPMATPTPQLPSEGKPGWPFSLETVAAALAIVSSVGGVAGWLVRRRAAEGKKRLLQRLLDEIDAIYARFRPNPTLCEAELYRLKGMISEKLKKGAISEQSYEILDKRLDDYMKEVKERAV